MDSLYSIYYNGEPFRLHGKKYIYFTLDNAETALKSVARRRARLTVDGWKLLDSDKQKKLVNEEIAKFEIVEYVRN